METKNQIQKMGNDIEGMLNDFEGGITEKEKTIIDILDYIVQRAEATVNNFKKELSKSLIGRIKFYKENNRPDNASTLEILLRDMQNDELLSFMEKDGFPVEAEVKVLKPTCSNCKHLGKYTDCDICNNKDLRLWNLSNCDINIEEWGCTYFEERKA